MWSLNVSIPQGIVRAIGEITPVLGRGEGIVEEPTLVIKRFEKEDLDGHIESEIKFLLENVEPFIVEIGNLEMFEVADRGTSPVRYIEVKSIGIKVLHETLVSVFGCVKGVEGENYIPHITIARGSGAKNLDFSDFSGPIQWTANTLEFWDRDKRKRKNKVILDKNK
ncbi:MAG TPA: 2'-5' RNA ligase family protein [Halobacteriales archaeon]|uniref:2'-5' RNA ligase family protein n=1 Tax=Candidatus Hikarchaeum yamanae TaxID=2675326 RepID=UPI0017A0AED1|nr:2'-5' RNA ligase family protein [Halobacteriales archaeon]